MKYSELLKETIWHINGLCHDPSLFPEPKGDFVLKETRTNNFFELAVWFESKEDSHVVMRQSLSTGNENLDMHEDQVEGMCWRFYISFMKYALFTVDGDDIINAENNTRFVVLSINTLASKGIDNLTYKNK